MSVATHAELRAALVQAVECIKGWHNMGGADGVWDLYFAHAPEMKLIRETLAKADGRDLHAVLDRINMTACYASEENTDARADALLLIGKLARGEVMP